MRYVTPKTIIAMGVVLPILGAFSVGLRFYTRRIMKARYLMDGWQV
jgi:hypothetical protein